MKVYLFVNCVIRGGAAFHVAPRADAKRAKRATHVALTQIAACGLLSKETRKEEAN